MLTLLFILGLHLLQKSLIVAKRIDTETKTELITSGLFGYSRNPIFFGMMISLVDFLLISPNIMTIIFLILGCGLMQIQIRLEEEFLLKEPGENDLNYHQKARRLI